MRVLLGLVLALSVVWGGYWFVGSAAMERGASAWFADQTALGLVADHGDIAVHGFPNRFDLTVDEIHLADPATGYGWIAPFVQILSLSYAPWHVIAALPNEQTFVTPFQTLTLGSAKLQGSLVVVPGTSLTLDRTRIVGDELRLASSLGWSGAARTLRFATQKLAPEGTQHEIGLELLDVALDPQLLASLPELPALIERAHLDATLDLTAPLDRYAGETQPQVTRIDVKDLQVTWGGLAFHGQGEVAANADGLAEGRIDLRLTNWRAAMPLLVASGLTTAEVRPTWENVLAALASQSGNPDDLDLPLTFQRGRMSLGPVPLGPAPRLR